MRAIFIFLLCNLGLIANTQPWQITFGTDLGEKGKGVVVTPQGDFVFTGILGFDNIPEGRQAAYLVKTDPLGNEIWSNSFLPDNWQGEGIGFAEGRAISLTSDGGFIIAGLAAYDQCVIPDPPVGVPCSEKGVLLLKTDSNGQKEWSVIIEELNDIVTGPQMTAIGFSVIQTSDGGYAVTGNTYFFSTGLTIDAFLLKTDANGQKEWITTFGGDAVDIGYAVVEQADSSFLVTGALGNPEDFTRDVLLTHIDKDGSIDWTQTYGGTNSDEAYSIILKENGNAVIAGSTASFGAGGFDVFLMEVDTDGTEVWFKTYGCAGNEVAYGMSPDIDNGYIIIGATFGIGHGGEDMLLIKTEEDGTESWIQTIGGTHDDEGRSVKPDPNGGYIITGITSSFGYGDTDVHLIKTDENGNSPSPESLHELIYVDSAAVNGNQDGTNWENAFSDLQVALDSAERGDVLWIARGTYFPADSLNRNASFELKEAVHLYGGFAGTETSFEERDLETNHTILSGNMGSADLKLDNSYHVVEAEDINTVTFCDGFIIANGFDDSEDPVRSGAGMSVHNASTGLMISNCLFIQNESLANGGALSYTFESNVLEPSIQVGNVVLGLECPNIQNCSFDQNKAQNGAAIYLSVPEESMFTFHAKQCQFINNEADNGGAVYSDHARMSFFNCLFDHNDASESGGALYADSCNLLLANCIFYRNEADLNGSVYFGERNILDLVNCTVYDDSSLESTVYQKNASIQLINSILWGNEVMVLSEGTSTVEAEYCLVQGGIEGNENLDANPYFIDAENGNLQLDIQSPAINTGSGYVLSSIDFNHNPRIIYDIIDRGAYEANCLYGLTLQIDSVSCAGGADGAVLVDWSGGLSPFQTNWEHGDTLPLATELPVGTYHLTITDSMTCTHVVEVIVEEPSELEGEIIVQHQTAGSMDGGIAVTAHGGTPPYYYSWNTEPSEIGPSIDGLSAGTYEVTLTDNNDCVWDTLIVLDQIVSLHTIHKANAIEIFPNPTAEMIYIYQRDTELPFSDLEIYNMQGYQVPSFRIENSSKSEIQIDVSRLMSGIYLLRMGTFHSFFVRG